MPRLLNALLLAALLGAPFSAPHASGAQSLEAVRASGRLTCGTVQAADDWNAQQIHGNLSELGADVCRAVAVAALGHEDGLRIVVFPTELEALGALKAGQLQLAVGISPATTTATQFGVAFGPPVFYDSQRIMVAKQSGITDLDGLRDRLICAMDLSPPEQTLRDALGARDIPFALMSHSEQGEMDAAVAVRRCEAGVGTETRLASSRANFHARVSDFVYLPDRLTIDPIAPAYRYGDQAFGLLVDWTVGALIEAEALGITRENVAKAAGRTDLRSERLLGGDFAVAQALGLSHDWAAKVIADVGNYGEIFERNAGQPYHLERGLNALWTDGGLMAPMPMQ